MTRDQPKCTLLKFDFIVHSVSESLFPIRSQEMNSRNSPQRVLVESTSCKIGIDKIGPVPILVAGNWSKFRVYFFWFLFPRFLFLDDTLYTVQRTITQKGKQIQYR